MFGWLNELISASPLAYLVLVGLSIADISGLVPAETVIATATLLAIDGELSLPAVCLAAVSGVGIGDTILYALGRTVGGRLAPRVFRSDSARERLHWAQQRMQRHGGVIIIAGRFLPMGRTATIFAAGTLGLSRMRCAAADGVAIALWASYYIGVTVVLGRSLHGNVWLALLLSIGIALVVGFVAEAVRRYGVYRARVRE